jgi:hypothetical protein
LGVYLRAALGLLPHSRRSELPTAELRRSVPVDRDRLIRYDRVCGFPLSSALPATYPHVLAFPLAMRLMSAPDFPFGVVGLVHVANRITLHRPLSADTPLDVTVRAVNLRRHDRGRQFDIEASATVSGERAWTGVSTYLRKETPGTNGRDRPALPEPTAVWKVPARIGREYAAVSGDHNPIHISHLGARLFGYPRPIAHGMWSLARCLAALTGRLPAAYTVEVDFKRPLLVPAEVSFSSDESTFMMFGDVPHLVGRISPS